MPSQDPAANAAHSSSCAGFRSARDGFFGLAGIVGGGGLRGMAPSEVFGAAPAQGETGSFRSAAWVPLKRVTVSRCLVTRPRSTPLCCDSSAAGRETVGGAINSCLRRIASEAVALEIFAE